MGAIQQSINAALNTATTAAAVGKGIASYGKQKEAELKKEQAELTKAENERIAGQQGVIAQAEELQKEFQEGEKAGAELDFQIKQKEDYIKGNAFYTPHGKALEEAKKQLAELQNQKKLQQAQLASRVEGFRKRKELIDQKAALYGMKPIDIVNEKGGKK